MKREDGRWSKFRRRMMQHMAGRLGLATALVTVLSAQSPAPPGPWALDVHPVPSPARDDSGQPQLTASDRGLLLSWIERDGQQATLKFAEWRGNQWSAPTSVAHGSDWFVNWADVPSVVRLADGSLAAHWLQKSGPGTYAYDVRLSFSRDDGRTWSASVTPHHDGTQTEHGFASLFQLPGSSLGLVWLDGRAMKGGEHAGHGNGAMSLRYGAFDRNRKQTSEAAIDLRVCECCPTAAVVTVDGVLAAFRNRTDDEVRDIYVTRLEKDGWTEPAAVHDDGWRIAACPVNGPALSANGRAVAIAWFTMKEDVGHALLAFSDDGGRSFGRPIQLDDGQSSGRVDVALLPDGSAAASYVEFADGRSQLRLRRVQRSGAKSAPVAVAGIDSGRTSGYPRMAVHDDQLVLAWIEREKTLKVRTAVARLPRKP